MWSTVVNDDAARKRDGAKMNRVVNSTLRYVPGQGRCAFPVRNPGHRPRRPAHGGQAKVSNFLHRGVKWQTTEKDFWPPRYRRLKRTTVKARLCDWAAGTSWCPSAAVPQRVCGCVRRWASASYLA